LAALFRKSDEGVNDLMSYQFKKMLVTGGAGFIGSHFIHTILQSHPDTLVINLDLMTYAASIKNLTMLRQNPQYMFVKGDICDSALVIQILKEHQIDTIVHFAAESHVDRSIANPVDFIQTNIVGTYQLLEAARQYWQGQNISKAQCRFHHISTDEVYGSLSSEQAAFTEQSNYLPNSPYAASKAGSDHLVRAYHHTYGLPVSLSHCSNNYGPYQHAEKLIPTVITACLQQKPIPIYGDGSQVRDWLHVLDHCAAIELIISKASYGQTYNIGGGMAIDNLSLVKMICLQVDKLIPQHAPHAQLIQFVKDRLGHDWRYAIDAKKIHGELGWQPTIEFAQGLGDTIQWYINNYQEL
jgi:dTDP-glucose 4,6-dehydratase